MFVKIVLLKLSQQYRKQKIQNADMPKLTWVGKEKVINHHHEVPFRVLERKYNFTASDDNSTGNRIIHGDNLEALKSLLPEYEGKVKCIYIDPPYNTGNEGWIYNDNVNDEKIKKWLGQVVGKEGEDLSRHDKWLCMMYPRLKLLHKLLAENGSIWVSIDDIEVGNLRLVLDEIFSPNNFIADVLWQKKYTVANDHKTIAPMHDHILVYQKSGNWKRNLIPRTAEKDSQYKFEDEKGIYRTSDYTCNKSADERPNLYYPIINPNTGKEVLPKRTRVWAYSKDVHQQHIAEDLIAWGKTGKATMPSFKRYKDNLKNADGIVPSTWWTFEFAGHTDESKKEIRAILFDNPSASDFITPKPTRLIERILSIASDENSIVLDSFAGSGTTAHAVLKLNQSDGGNRKFILIETMDYAETITAERVRRVMRGYGEDAKRVEGLGGAFDYYEIGERIFQEDGNLNESIGAEEIRRYVAFSENIPSDRQLSLDNKISPYLLGLIDETAYFFIYEKDAITTLDLEFLANLNFKPTAAIIYADNCLLTREFMQKHNIIFKKIPREIIRF